MSVSDTFLMHSVALMTSQMGFVLFAAGLRTCSLNYQTKAKD